MSDQELHAFEKAMDELELQDEEYQKVKYLGLDEDEVEESLELEDYTESDFKTWLRLR